MRVLLGAVQCEKGDLSRNLARHVALMSEAHSSGCDLAIFPEFSLTGSVDPLAHPDHAVTLEHPAVAELVDATAALGVGVVFGLAEHRDDDFFITQAYATSGELFGVQRRHFRAHVPEGYVPRDTGRAAPARSPHVGAAPQDRRSGLMWSDRAAPVAHDLRSDTMEGEGVAMLDPCSVYVDGQERMKRSCRGSIGRRSRP